MNIRDYIKKRGLTKWRTWPVVTESLAQQFVQPGMPLFFISADAGEFDRADKFEIYANTEHTLFVSLNVTRNLFRIVHYEMLVFYSKWESMRPGLDYTELEKL